MTSMTPQRYDQVRSLFAEVCDLDALSRSAILDERCANDTELRCEVESLLNEEQSDDFLDATRSGLIPRLLNRFDIDQAQVPPSIGKFSITRLIGRGGMGTVYEAVQDNPRRTVAIKIVSAQLGSNSLLQRFAHEAHVLARLQHPGIAQIFEAGIAQTSEGDQPYFAMEYVQGKPLLHHCKDLSNRQKLELMARVADAIHHAHMNGVIHRDLKPSNILVKELSRDQGKHDDPRDVGPIGQPKILDFGVARLTDSDLQITTINTAVGQLIGTVSYMSPEQASGDPSLVDTRSDVFSLGVLCFELLVSRHPLALEKMNLHGALAIIRDKEPARLSSIDRAFRGDVETIVAKALEKDKDQRYASAAEFANDIRRYLNDEPVMARAPSAAYRFRKFARRNKALMCSAAAILLILILGASGTTYGLVMALQEASSAQLAESIARDRLVEADRARDEAQNEAQKAIAVRDLLRELLGSADPDVAQGKDLTVKEMLAESVSRIDAELGDQPELRAAVQATIGICYRQLGYYEIAQTQLEQALDARLRTLGQDHLETLESMNDLGLVLLDQSRFAESEILFTESLNGRRRLLGPEHPSTLTAMHNMALLLQRRSKLGEAESLLRTTVEARERLLGADHPNTLTSQNNLVTVLLNNRKYDDAEPLCRRVYQQRLSQNGERHPETTTSLLNLAICLQNQRRFAESTPLFEQVIELRRAVLGADHPQTLRAMEAFGKALIDEGKLHAAERVLRDHLDRQLAVSGEESATTAAAMQSLALALARANRNDEAEVLLRSAFEIRECALGPDEADTLTSLSMLATVLKKQGRAIETVPLQRRVLEARLRVLGPDHPSTLTTFNNFASLLHDLGQLDESESLHRSCFESRQRLFGSESLETLTSAHNLGDLLEEQGKLGEAIQLDTFAYEGRRNVLGREHPDTVASMVNTVMLLIKMKDYEPAAPLALELLEVAPKAKMSALNMAGLRRLCGNCYFHLGDFPQAEAHLLQSLQEFRDMNADKRLSDRVTRELVELYQAWGRVDDQTKYQAMLELGQPKAGQ